MVLVPMVVSTQETLLQFICYSLYLMVGLSNLGAAAWSMFSTLTGIQEESMISQSVQLFTCYD